MRRHIPNRSSDQRTPVSRAAHHSLPLRARLYAAQIAVMPGLPACARLRYESSSVECEARRCAHGRSHDGRRAPRAHENAANIQHNESERLDRQGLRVAGRGGGRAHTRAVAQPTARRSSATTTRRQRCLTAGHDRAGVQHSCKRGACPGARRFRNAHGPAATGTMATGTLALIQQGFIGTGSRPRQPRLASPRPSIVEPAHAPCL